MTEYAPDGCTPLLGTTTTGEHDRRIESWHTRDCGLLDRDVPCSCGGCPDHNTGQRLTATPQGYAEMLRRERQIGRDFVAAAAKRARRRYWPAPPGPAGWFWKDPVEEAEQRFRDRMAFEVRQHAQLGFMVNHTTSAWRLVTSVT